MASLKALAKVCDLMNPESVKEAIASKAVTEGTKKKLVEIYDRFCRQYGFT